ncbi:MAG: hypothetical protein KJ767_03905 [Nanoarchaeota archaeon]|nr:hypothetical protein [Nanoarchaeota archaeon]
MPEESIKISRRALFFIMAFVIVLAVGFAFGWLIRPSVTGAVIAGDTAGQNLVDFLNERIGGGISLVNVAEEGPLYKVTLLYQGQETFAYTTKDGEYFIIGAEKIVSGTETETNAGTNTNVNKGIPKSDKPSVELFIWSYCPYGVQAQGPFVEVANLLGNTADFNVVLYHDGHGAYETQQNKIQACIQKLDKEKYWSYAERFVQEIYPNCGASRDADCDKTESIKSMDSLGIDSTKIMSCVTSEGSTLLNEQIQQARELGVTGSPTLAINGMVVNVVRNADSFKQAICSAYNNPPGDCGTTLETTASTTTATAAGNC